MQHPEEQQRLLDELAAGWVGSGFAAVSARLADAQRWAVARGHRSLLELSTAELEVYLAGLNDNQRRIALVGLRRLYLVAVERERLVESPLAMSLGAAIEALYPAAVRYVEAASHELAPSTRDTMRRAVLRFFEWCAVHQADPVGIVPRLAEQYLFEMVPDPAQQPYWRDLSALRRLFDLLVRAGVRESHPFPRRVVRSLQRTPQEPLTPLIKRVLRHYGRASRATVLSDLSRFIAEIRAAGHDPLDLQPAVFERLIERNPRGRRLWRPYGRLLDEADKAGQLGERAKALHRQLSGGSILGRRRLLMRWKAWTAEHQYEHPGLVPALRREQYLSALRAAGESDEAVAAMRSAIRSYENEARRLGLRAARPRRLEKLAGRLAQLGVAEHDADAFIAQLHAGYKPSVHRSLEAVIVRFLDWSAANGVYPPSATDEQLGRFKAERGDHLGIAPVRRLIETWQRYRAGALGRVDAGEAVDVAAADDPSAATPAPAPALELAATG